MRLNTEPVNPNVMTPQQYSSGSNLQATNRNTANWVLFISPGLSLRVPLSNFSVHYQNLFFLILNKAVILLHSHTPWGTQTLYKLPSIMGPVTTTTDAGNAGTGFTKVRRVTLVIRSVCQGRSLCFMFWCISSMYWNNTRKVSMDLHLGSCEQNLPLPEHNFSVGNALRKISSAS